MQRKSDIIKTFVVSVLLMGMGTAGYMIIEGWGVIDGLYMTVITLATVGFGEVQRLSPSGRIFTLLLIFLGVGFYLYVVGNVIQFLMEGRIQAILGRRRVDRQIKKLDKHFILCGYGRIGQVLCRYLTQKYLDVVVVERSESQKAQLDEDGVLYILGEATDEAVLARAGIERARGVISALATDADNVFLTLTARQMNHDVLIVARAVQNSTKKKLYAAGASKVVSPYDLGARRMAHAILRPTVIHFLELAFADDDADIQVEEFVVSEKSPLAGLQLIDSGIRKDLNVILLSIKKADGQMIFNPAANTEIEAKDTLVAVGDGASMARLQKRTAGRF